MRGVYSHGDLKRVICEYVDTIPRLLASHPETLELANEFEESDAKSIKKCFEEKFTVAIIGQANMGKSTLLNALIGEKDLLPTFHLPTTATINYVRYDPCQAQRKIFRVHWRDKKRKPADIPLSELRPRDSKWTGDSEIDICFRKKIDYLDFYTASEFFKDVVFIDLPGVSSDSSEHEELPRRIISQKETAFAGRADALIYVCGPLVKPDDVDLAKIFRDGTQLPGASPANSIALLQKWDKAAMGKWDGAWLNDRNAANLLAERDKFVEVAENGLNKSDPLVYKVLPTSGLLATAAQNAGEIPWDVLAALGQRKSECCVKLLKDEGKFSEKLECIEKADALKKRDDIPWDDIPWDVIKFSILLAHFKKIDDGETLRKEVLAASGIEELKNVLREVFFTKASVIKSLTSAVKLVFLCKQASGKLWLLHERLSDMMGDLAESLLDNILPGSGANLEEIKLVQNYVKALRSVARNSITALESLRKKIGSIHGHLENNCNLFSGDIMCVNRLEDIEKRVAKKDADFSAIDEKLRESLSQLWDAGNRRKNELRSLFGAEGTSMEERLGFKDEPMKDLGKELILCTKELEMAYSPLISIDDEIDNEHYKHAVTRLELIQGALPVCKSSKERLQRLFDANGTSVGDRLGLSPEEKWDERRIEEFHDLCVELTALVPEEIQVIYKHAVDRLDNILDDMRGT